MTTKLTAGQAVAQQRRNVIAYLRRLLRDYDRPEVTDAEIKAVLRAAIPWIAGSARRYNMPARKGGLGR